MSPAQPSAAGRGRFSNSLPPVEVVVVTATPSHEIAASDIRESLEMERHLHDLVPPDATVSRSFGSAGSLRHKLRGTSGESYGTEFLSYYSVTSEEAPPDEIASRLLADGGVEAAFVKPPAEPPIAPDDGEAGAGPGAPAGAADAPPATADFTALQGYLDAAPDGVNARWAWTRPGGRGQGIRIIDVEGAWLFTHEDLAQNQGGVIGGAQTGDQAWRDHGTAVVGEISGDRNAIGITGIVPEANIRAVSIFGSGGSAQAIRTAADALGAGDILLIELHRPGPRNGFASRDDQLGYIAVEWWPDDHAAIRYALSRGVVVVEAAGNGAENLDDRLYDNRPTGFPASWTNPFRGGAADSGAIVVGAGAPATGTSGPPRSRLDFSNFGARVDAQGWGRGVVTTGYGDLQGPPSVDETAWYTRVFSGTSSASPIVVGAAAAYQGISAAGSGRRTPEQIRQRLRTTGSAQQDAPGRPATQRIGRLPDIRAMVGSVIKFKDVKDTKAEKNESKELKLEKLEVKEKIEKIETKELKSETKEFKIEKIETKEFEQKNREIGGKLAETGAAPQQLPGSVTDQDRLAALEQTVGQLQHFIQQSLRPDLGEGALGYEDMQAQATASKNEKDLKDVEKLSET
jgi:hypothetical protein